MAKLTDEQIDALLPAIRDALRKAHGDTGFGDVTIEFRNVMPPKIEWQNKGRESPVSK